MAYQDERSASYTLEEQKKLASGWNPYGGKTKTIGGQYAGMSQAERQRAKAAKKAAAAQREVVAEVGDDFSTLADGLGIDAGDLAKANPDTNNVSAGATYNVPTYGGLTEEEQWNMDNLGVPANYIDFLTNQETKDVYGNYKYATQGDLGGVGGAYAGSTSGATSPYYETDFGELQIPEGMNFEEFRMFAENTKDTGFWDDYGRTQEGTLDYSVENVLNLPTMGITDETLDPRYQSYNAQELSEQGFGEYFDPIETGGLPTYAKWGQNPVTGEWEAKPPEAVFDALYELNGIDPNDPAAVEFFWSLADEDMLYAGEFFDVIEWPGGGGAATGGYGGMPTPSRQYGRGQQQTRGDYASYVSLTSWSI